MRRITGVKRVARRRKDDLREELWIEKCLMGRLAMKLAGHVERMNDDCLTRMYCNYIHQEKGRRIIIIIIIIVFIYIAPYIRN